MLNDWSDRAPPQKRRPFIASKQFWFGVATALIGLTVAFGVAVALVG